MPRKKSFPRNKSGGRQLVEMHGVRSVKGKAKSAEQFRLECVYADASLFLFLSSCPSRAFLLFRSHSHSYYFSSVLVTIRTPETKESFERGKDKSREWLRGRKGERKGRRYGKREKEKGRATRMVGCKGGSCSRSCFISG